MTSRSATAPAPAQRRHKNFEETHQEMIETAVRLISQKGVEALSIAAIARSMGINRTTVYYHFESRDALLAAVKIWSSDQLAKAFNEESPQPERIDYITRFVLENPELIKLWIEDFVSPGDIRTSYPLWDALVEGVRKHYAATAEGEEVDAEVYCVIMLTAAIIGPRVFQYRVRPKEKMEKIIKRFRDEQERLLKHELFFKG